MPVRPSELKRRAFCRGSAGARKSPQKRAPPLEREWVTVASSNGVINLSRDEAKVLAEAARVLKARGRFAVSDVVANPNLERRRGSTRARGPAASPAR